MRSTSQKTRQMKAAVEAILFAMGGSVEVEKIAAALEMKVESTEELLADMMEQYKKEDRGIQIVELEHAYQLCTKLGVLFQPSLITGMVDKSIAGIAQADWKILRLKKRCNCPGNGRSDIRA